MDRYEKRVKDAILAEDMESLKRFAFGRECGCLGARGNEPRCPCGMLSDEVRRHIVPSALRYGKIVLID